MKKDFQDIIDALDRSSDDEINSLEKTSLNTFLKENKIKENKENLEFIRYLFIITKRNRELKQLTSGRTNLERLVGQSLRVLKGIYPVYSAVRQEEVLTYIIYFQVRIEKWIHFEGEVLKKTGLDSFEESQSMILHYWQKINILAQILIYECDWDQVRYISLSSKLAAVRIDNFPIKILIDKKVLKGLKHKERVSKRPSKYDEWFKEVLKTYQAI